MFATGLIDRVANSLIIRLGENCPAPRLLPYVILCFLTGGESLEIRVNAHTSHVLTGESGDQAASRVHARGVPDQSPTISACPVTERAGGGAAVGTTTVKSLINLWRTNRCSSER